MSALERAEKDIRAGNLGMARQRLESYVSAKGYDPQLLARIGRICFDMKDTFNAGRHWFLSTAEGPEVECAVEHFVQCCGRKPQQVVNAFLRKARLPSSQSYPLLVQRRLERYGLSPHVVRVYEFQSRKRADSSIRGGKIAGLILSAIVLSCVASCMVGAQTILKWIFP